MYIYININIYIYIYIYKHSYTYIYVYIKIYVIFIYVYTCIGAIIGILMETSYKIQGHTPPSLWGKTPETPTTDPSIDNKIPEV
jgi:hypothetical protein